ncbi:MAG TPA: HupE/UreJ family protein [Tepidisphaeraceae bacterium]|jgi:urease accessory protein|nr:HupE/UreJ family protein [Tepidisphaeraceae bacterium]
MKSRSIVIAAGASVLAFATVASAHPGHGASGGFSAGISHPFLGIDHILAMVAVGLCAVQIGGRALWLLPLTFISFMIAGGVLGFNAGHVPPAVEQGIAASVLLLGLIVAGGSRLAVPLTFGLTALFAMFHGYAHGAEMQPGVAFATFAVGFVIATTILHLAGIALGVTLNRNRLPALARLAGGAIAIGGVLLFVG